MWNNKEKVRKMENIKCFFCKEKFNGVSLYMVHLNKHSKLCPGIVFECTIGTCHQKFYAKFSFKRHLENHIKKNKSLLFPNVKLQVFLK